MDVVLLHGGLITPLPEALIELIEVGDCRNRDKCVPPYVSDHVLDIAFLVSRSRVAKLRFKSVMELETSEAVCEFTLTAVEDFHDRGGHVVKPYHLRDSADVLKYTSHTCEKALLIL